MFIQPKSLYDAITKYFGNTSWLNWEPETLEVELAQAKKEKLDKYKKDEYFTTLVDAIRALLSKDSLALIHWHLFENAAQAFAGNIPDFSETTPPEPYELVYAIEFMRDFFPDLWAEFSDEVKMYIGSLFVSNGIFYHPSALVNRAINMALIHNDFNFDAEVEHQKNAVRHITNNKANLKKLVVHVFSSGETSALPEDTDPMAARAVQSIITLINVNKLRQKAADRLKTFLTEDRSKLPAPVISNIDADRDNPEMEGILNILASDVTDFIAHKSFVDNASIKDETMVAKDKLPPVESTDTIIDELVVEKVAINTTEDALPGLAGFNYHNGTLYAVTGEIGRDDVPKSKLLGGGSSGTVTNDSSTSKAFSSNSNALKVLDEHGNLIKKDKPKWQSGPADSSLELAEI